MIYLQIFQFFMGICFLFWWKVNIVCFSDKLGVGVDKFKCVGYK